MAQMKNLFYPLMLLIIPITVMAECTCEADEENRGDKTLALKYKLAAIASILTAGALGVCLPVAGKKVPALSPDRNLFFILKAFAGGVILSTGFIHVLPDAFDSLTSPCLSEDPWRNFPFTTFIAMLSAIGTLLVETYATAYFKQRSSSAVKLAAAADEEEVVLVETHSTHDHAHAHAHGAAASFELDSGEIELLRHRVISQVLELGIVVHSVIIGIALGASGNPKTIRPLIAALTFHQFFEGIGLGGCITQAKFNSRAVVSMALFFSFTTPVGIAIGICVSTIYSETSPMALIVEGVFNSASAGILIYMALVDLLAADFMSTRMQNNSKLQLWASAAVLLGAGCMSILAKWA